MSIRNEGQALRIDPVCEGATFPHQELFFMGGSIWILGLCVNKDGDSSCCGPAVLADQVVDPVGRVGDI